MKGSMKEKSKEERDKLQKFYTLSFSNQGVGSLIKTIYDKHRHLSSIRKVWTQEEKIKIKNKFLNICKNCGCDGTLHIDHKVALANGGTNDITNLQLLCVDCHDKKTKDELKHGYVNLDPIMSSFCDAVWKIFRSENMMKWAFTQQYNRILNKNGDDITIKASKYAYDIKRERKNNLYYSKYEWPVYTVMDKPETFEISETIKCGYYYVVSENCFPLRGNGWYSQPIIEYCIKEGIIKKEDIKYKLIPSIKLPCDHFKPFIDFVYANFPDHCKGLINSFIGMLYLMLCKNVSGMFTQSYEEACAYYFKNGGQNVTKEAGLYTVFFHSTIEYQETASPIYLQILDMEALELHKLASIVGLNSVTYLKTDCVYCTKKVDLSEYYWDDASCKKEKKYQVEPISSIPKNVKGNYARDDEYLYEEQSWNVVEDDDDFDKIADVIVNKNQGFNIDGPAGTGKNYINQYIEGKAQ